ncbi:MAG: pitrilysin family protein, partial [Spirochaetales bacterium]
MKKNIRTCTVSAVVCIGLLFTLSCASFNTDYNSDNEFEYYELDNGIPLIVKKNTASQILSLQINVQGGVALMQPQDSGLESALFEMMTMGSKNYSYQNLKEILYNTQSSFYAGSNQLGSTLGLTVIDYYFDDLLPVFIDGFLNPAFTQEEYTTLMTVTAQSLQYQQQDPNTLLRQTVRDTRYKGQPYETQATVTAESFPNITTEAMQNHLPLMHNAERITIVAVGDFDVNHLYEELNNTIGQLSAQAFDMPTIPPATQGGNPIVIGLEAAKGSGYVASTVPAPLPGTQDEIAARIAASMYSELLFNLVREQYGVTYSIGSSYAYSKAPYIMTVAYKVSDLQNIVQRIDEAQDYMAQGTLISGKNEITGDYEFSAIEERLEGYKNTLINSQFYSAQTNAAVSANIISSLLMFGNPEEYLNFTDRVHAVSADDVQRVFNTYWLSDEKQWFAVTGIGEENL